VSASGAGATPFWRVVSLLLGAARSRGIGRAERQRRLLHARDPKALDWGGVANFFLTIFSAALHGAIAMLLLAGLSAADRWRAEAAGKLAVSPRCLAALAVYEAEGPPSWSGAPTAGRPRTFVDPFSSLDCRARGVDDEAGDAWPARLREHYQRAGQAGLVAPDAPWGFARREAPLAGLGALFGSILVLAWFVFLAFQGEGVELDLQRRRFPMWEWLLAHPVDARAVFLAEMVAPIAANPSFWTAPIFWIGAFWIAYGSFGVALIAGLAAGIPLAAAAGCVGKALEVAVLLRVAPRSRGAILGILSWLGQAALLLLMMLAFSRSGADLVIRALARAAGDAGAPLFGWMLGGVGAPAAWKGVLACWAIAAAVVALSAGLAARATDRGLAGGFDAGAPAPARAAGGGRAWLRDPVHRKELLWLWRDRGSLVQIFLVPLTAAAYQLFNLRRVLSGAGHAWHLMAGAAVMFGCWFLFVLGPRSLVSEGPALWIPLGWPRGLEAVMRAKARLWWLASLLVVMPLLLVTAIRFPADAGRVALVAVLWAVFARSLAEKTVTLATAPSSSGEPEPVPRGRRWAASLGTFTFGVGILSRQWHVAAIGVAYSWLTAAALWQGFRARLPYLLDPWSERAPPPPTLAHALVAISGMTEGMALVFTGAILVAGPGNVIFAQALAYGIAGLAAFIVTSHWLDHRGVSMARIWTWGEPRPGLAPLARGAAAGLALGAALGVAAVGYLVLAEHVPGWDEAIRQSRDALARHPMGRRWEVLMAVGIAPLAEEFLFRGLLYRALDREWRGARAVLGSACFFAFYHPPLAWLPVGLVGVASAVLFRRSGNLLPSVLLHLAYNAVVSWG
jgi:membrane protease YdiL (CAAX protease family)